MTTTPFGPQLIGETEKTLGALLRQALRGTGLTEPLWVSLVIASTAPAGDLAEAIAARALFEDAPALVADLGAKGLVDGAGITAAGLALIDEVRARTNTTGAGVWDLPPSDVEAATRVLNAVRDRARALLASS